MLRRLWQTPSRLHCSHVLLCVRSDLAIHPRLLGEHGCTGHGAIGVADRDCLCVVYGIQMQQLYSLLETVYALVSRFAL